MHWYLVYKTVYSYGTVYVHRSGVMQRGNHSQVQVQSLVSASETTHNWSRVDRNQFISNVIA